MIVTIDKRYGRELLEIREALRDGRSDEVIGCRIGRSNVLVAAPARVPVGLAEQITGRWPMARLVAATTASPLAEREHFPADTVVNLGPAAIGGTAFTIMAGPCAVEDRNSLRASATTVRDAGATVLRGGAYKPRTSPHAFQGTGDDGVRLLAEVGRETGLPVVSEVVDPRDVARMAHHVDMFQIGARNAQNFSLLSEVGRTGVPVLVKRGFGCTVDEWLGAAEYVLRAGNPHVVLCERGIRTFESATRFTLDLASVAALKRRTHLPVVVDPSHGTGRRDLVPELALAAAAVGADGLLVDVHPDPGSARCDADQALTGDGFDHLMRRLRSLLPALGRSHAPLAASARSAAA